MGIGLSALASVASAQPFIVKDDPFLAYRTAEIRAAIPPPKGRARFCHGGGDFSVWIDVPRNGGAPTYGVTAIVRRMRDQIRLVSIEIYGALGLTDRQSSYGNIGCYHASCTTDFSLTYGLPAETVAALETATTTPVRINSNAGEDCDIVVEITDMQLRKLEAWASTPP